MSVLSQAYEAGREAAFQKFAGGRAVKPGLAGLGRQPATSPHGATPASGLAGVPAFQGTQPAALGTPNPVHGPKATPTAALPNVQTLQAGPQSWGRRIMNGVNSPMGANLAGMGMMMGMNYLMTPRQ